ncbi:hypothetical protein NT6N_06080 [Oceaniferula spumae]|uniref:TPM domain-containing protein n=1 Tax=Oceaniferula spumae TaxID=2979115 RepID=A0AAT9FHV7_9BACT
MQDLDAHYGAGEVRMRRLSDSAGVLRLKERKKVEKWFDQFEATFPELFFSVYFGALDERSNIRQFGLWLLNRGAFEDVDLSRPNDGGVLLVVDVNSKAAFIASGYLLDVYLKEEDTFRALSKAHPHFLQGNYFRALKSIMGNISGSLRKRSRQANRNPEKYQRLIGQSQQDMGDILQRIRSGKDEATKDLSRRPAVDENHLQQHVQ